MSESVVPVLDVPPNDAPWLAINPTVEWSGEGLQFRKRLLLSCYLPQA